MCKNVNTVSVFGAKKTLGPNDARVNRNGEALEVDDMLPYWLLVVSFYYNIENYTLYCK